MAARLLDHFMTLRTAIREIEAPAAAQPGREVQPTAPQAPGWLHRDMEAQLGQDARYRDLKTCMAQSHDDPAQARDRAWDLAESIAADYAEVHPWSLLMVALRGGLTEAERGDAELNASLDELEACGVLLWKNSAAL